ncbi:nucleotidyltransferase domain-containing protein [Kribbella deserti]|uniref:Nucleotidyltransferase domain-containing protein n=1 Tax=Kribbella deserti TaxID=1926257 RepID=A0ABV6QTJ5_9ACTN
MEALEVAARLVGERFPGALAAWLGGSVARGTATRTSDLEITVLLAGPPAPYRESLEYGGWPVELFVHTEASLALDDLLGASGNDECAAIAATRWADAAELLLLGDGWWIGIGKGVLRELQAYDGAHGTTYGRSLVAGLRSAANGDIGPLVMAVEGVLDARGGRLFGGFHLAAELDVGVHSSESAL